MIEPDLASGFSLLRDGCAVVSVQNGCRAAWPALYVAGQPFTKIAMKRLKTVLFIDVEVGHQFYMRNCVWLKIDHETANRVGEVGRANPEPVPLFLCVEVEIVRKQRESSRQAMLESA
jgi:hypothetical protein